MDEKYLFMLDKGGLLICQNIGIMKMIMIGMMIMIMRAMDVYWYGKYYPKEDIDALFKDSSAEDIQEGRGSNVGWALLVLVSIGAAGYGIYKKMIQGKDLPKKIVN